MQFKVTILNEKNEIISEDIWYGDSISSVKVWVEIALSNIVKTTSYYTNLHYEIEKL